MSSGRTALTVTFGTSTMRADLQVHRHATDRVRLLAGVLPLLHQVVDHRQQRVAGRQRRVLGLLGAVVAHREAGRGVEAARRLEARIDDVLLAAVLDAPDVPPSGLALAQVERRPRTSRTSRPPCRRPRRRPARSGRRRPRRGRPGRRPGSAGSCRPSTASRPGCRRSRAAGSCGARCWRWPGRSGRRRSGPAAARCRPGRRPRPRGRSAWREARPTAPSRSRP